MKTGIQPNPGTFCILNTIYQTAVNTQNNHTCLTNVTTSTTTFKHINKAFH